MSELFDDEDEKALIEEEFEEEEDIAIDTRPRGSADARRRLEDMLEEKRLRDELEDFTDYE